MAKEYKPIWQGRILNPLEPRREQETPLFRNVEEFELRQRQIKEHGILLEAYDSLCYSLDPNSPAYASLVIRVHETINDLEAFSNSSDKCALRLAKQAIAEA